MILVIIPERKKKFGGIERAGLIYSLKRGAIRSGLRSITDQSG